MGNGEDKRGVREIADDELIKIFHQSHREIVRPRATPITNQEIRIRGNHLNVEQGGDTGITCRFLDADGIRSEVALPLWTGRSIVRPYAGFALTIPSGLSAGDLVLVSSPVFLPTPNNLFSLRDVLPGEFELTAIGRRVKNSMLALGRMIDRTTTVLGIGATFTGAEVLTAIDASSVEVETLASMLILQTVAVAVVCFADQAGTLRIQSRLNAAGTFRTIRSQAVTANVAQWVQHPCTGNHRWRIIYDNGGTAQGAFELQSMYHGPGATGPGFTVSP